MSVQTVPPIEQPLAEQAARDCDLSPPARAMLAPQLKAGAYLAQLARQNLWLDALRFSPYALQRRSAVWWGTLCLWQFYRPAPALEVDRCLQAVVAWLKNPGEAERRAAYDASRIAKTTTPAGNLALAAFFEFGSIAPAGQPEVPSRPRYTPQAIASAITLAVKQTPRELQPARQTDYVRLALEVMAGRWPLPASSKELHECR